jgi:hypothetical protein
MSTYEELSRQIRLETAVDQHEQRLDAINGSIDRFGREMQSFREEFVRIKARTAIFAAIGGVLGTAVVGGIISFVVLSASP